MRNNHRFLTAWTILMLLVPGSLPVGRSAAILVPGPDQTILDVMKNGAQTQWGSSRTIHSLHIVNFRWKTTAPNTVTGAWEMFDYKPQPMGMNETPFTKGTVAIPLPGQFQEFPIDIAQLQQQFPNKIPANAPANGKDYYIRIKPLTGTGTLAGEISDLVKITYVKSSSPSNNPLTFDYSAVFFTGGHYVDIGYSTNKPIIPVITVSRSAPMKDSHGDPKFGKKAKIVSTSFPFLAGYDNDGVAQLSGLTPKTHFHYIIRAKDEKGEVAYTSGEFTTATRSATVTFEKIFMIDDSDGFPSGAGDLNFAFFVNGVNALGNNKTFPPKDAMDFPTGETRSFDNIFMTVKDPPDLLSARVNGHDTDDCGDILHHPLCSCEDFITNPKMSNGRCKDGSGENSAALKTLHIPDVTDRSQFGIEYDKEDFTMIGDNHHLKFKVFGSFSVRYH